jgi:hypothetical protein
MSTLFWARIPFLIFLLAAVALLAWLSIARSR